MTRSSSTQPLSPAALISAYSPETWYAAVGMPNVSLTRKRTSR